MQIHRKTEVKLASRPQLCLDCSISLSFSSVYVTHLSLKENTGLIHIPILVRNLFSTKMSSST